jgi:flagellar biosynthesis/type III secretory pathway chaperone
MSTIATAEIIQEIVKKSVTIAILCVAAYLFYNDNRNMIEDYRNETRTEIAELKSEIRTCNQNNKVILENQIEKNNAFLQRIEDYLMRNRR